MTKASETFTSRVVDGALDTIEMAALLNGRTPFNFGANPKLRDAAEYIATGAVAHFINLTVQHGGSDHLEAIVQLIGNAWIEEAS